MRFSDIARSCTQNLLRRKSRTILTVLGVIVGCCSIVLMISIGQGINEQNEQMLKNMGNLNDITVYADGRRFTFHGNVIQRERCRRRTGETRR